MLKKLSGLAFAMVLVAGLTSSAQAQHRWVLLGERHIDGHMDTDNVVVGKDNGTFRAIQFRVEGGDVRFEKIQVKYLNGTVEDIDVRSDIPAGGRTRVIETVSMWYSKGEWHTRPSVKVYGIR